MNVELTQDMALVKEILGEPGIWERAAEDCIDKSTFIPAYSDMNGWLLCTDNDEIIGVILVQTETSVSAQIHPYLRKEHHKQGRKMMRCLYEWILDNTGVEKVNAVIPTLHKIVINFSCKVGFKKEGISRNSWKQGGKIYDRQLLGITREEIGDYLNG